MPRSATPRTWLIWSRTCSASFVSTSRFGPTILTELTPLTPEIPSSMLSSMYCEKLKTTPGSSLLNSVWISSVSFSLVRPRGHSSKGLSGANNSTFENGEASLPSSGRPCCETTVMHFRVAQQDLAHLARGRLAVFQRKRDRHGSANPEIAFFQVGKELAAEP